MRTDIYKDILIGLEREGRLRKIPSEHIEGNIDLCSNDYLGLASRYAEYLPEFLNLYNDAPMSSSASRLLSGYQKYHRKLEDYLSVRYGKDVLLFNSGYHANVGCIQALSTPETVFLTDRLIHASVIDGIRMAKAKFERWNHNDISHLGKLLEKHKNDNCKLIIVAESVYSMDGDTAPLRELIELKHKYPGTLIYLDEAHALGTIGKTGLGLSEQLNIIEDIDIIIGTFGKACASQGAFAATSISLKQLFINCSRPFIFSTAIPPFNCAWTLFMLEKIRNMESERKQLMKVSHYFKNRISKFSKNRIESDSQIVPLITGSAESAVKLAEHLNHHGITALPIRRPTVAPGTERIRFSLNSDISENTAQYVAEVIEDYLS